MTKKLVTILLLGLILAIASAAIGKEAPPLATDSIDRIGGIGTRAVDGWVASQGNTMQIHWSRQGEPAGTQGYHIYRSSDGVNYTKITSSPVWPDYYDRSLASGIYYYRIYIVSSGGIETFWVGTLVGFIF